MVVGGAVWVRIWRGGSMPRVWEMVVLSEGPLGETGTGWCGRVALLLL